MSEVELTTELYAAMEKGIAGKSKKSLDDLYKKYDTEFPLKRSIERRFETVMDVIDDNFGSKFSGTVFSKKSLFYVFFVTIFHQSYGTKNPLKNKKQERLTKWQVNKIYKLSEILRDKKAPENVISGQHSTTHKTTRDDQYKWLVKELGSDV